MRNGKRPDREASGALIMVTDNILYEPPLYPEKAKERGVHFGQRKTLTREHTRELQRQRVQGELMKTLMIGYYGVKSIKNENECPAPPLTVPSLV